MTTDALEREAPLAPFDFQEADLVTLRNGDYVGFVVAETGAGKSLIGIEAGLRSGSEIIFVIAPKGTHGHVWVEGILRQDPTVNVSVIHSRNKAGKQAMADLEMGEPGWYIVTPQLFTTRKWDHIRGVDMLIVDEAHLFGNHETAGFKALKKFATPSGRPRIPHRIFMSGTIYRNKFENIWSLGRILYPERNEDGDIFDIARNRWITKYCATKYDHFAPGNRIVIGELHPGTLANLVPTWVQHFKRMECCEFHPNGFLENLPEPIVIRETVELTEGQKKAIARMETDYVAWLETEYKTKRALIVKLPVVMQTRLRQMTLGLPSFRETGEIDEHGNPVQEIWFAPGCESPKLDRYHERLIETNDEPCLLLTSSEKFAHEAARRITEDWGIPALKYTGKTTDGLRDFAKAEFAAGRTRVIVATMASIGTGTDGLQHSCSWLYWLDKSLDLTDNTQTEGRLDRRGQTKQVVNEEILAEGSADENVISNQLRRRLALNASMKKKLNREKRAA